MRVVRTGVLAIGFALAIQAGASAGTVTLSGPDSKDGTYSSQDIANTANAGNTVTADGLTGISLWSFLGGAAGGSVVTNADGSKTRSYGSITTFNPAGGNSNPNFDLRYYVVGIGSGGAQSVVSLGQIDPMFAGTSPTTPIVAFQTSGGTPLGSPELVVPGGPAGSTIQNLTSLQLTSIGGLPQGAGGKSTSITLAGNVASPGVYTTFPTTDSVTVCSSNRCIPAGTTTYNGMPLDSFLNATSPSLPSQIVVVKATDGYQVVYSLSELLLATGAANPADLLALLLSTDNNGFARTITGGDSAFAHGRWVSNVLEIDVLNATPIPAALPLFATGAGLLSLLGWRRRRSPRRLSLVDGQGNFSDAAARTASRAMLPRCRGFPLGAAAFILEPNGSGAGVVQW